MDDKIMQLLVSHNVTLLIFPSHTSNLVQPLDLVMFALFKRAKWEIQVKLPAEFQVWQITPLMRALERRQRTPRRIDLRPNELD
jgi:hypothetical protein